MDRARIHEGIRWMRFEDVLGRSARPAGSFAARAPGRAEPELWTRHWRAARSAFSPEPRPSARRRQALLHQKERRWNGVAPRPGHASAFPGRGHARRIQKSHLALHPFQDKSRSKLRRGRENPRRPNGGRHRRKHRHTRPTETGVSNDGLRTGAMGRARPVVTHRPEPSNPKGDILTLP